MGKRKTQKPKQSSKFNRERLILKRKLEFPKCTEIYEECKGRVEPCSTCPYKEDWLKKQKKKKIKINEEVKENVPNMQKV